MITFIIIAIDLVKFRDSFDKSLGTVSDKKSSPASFSTILNLFLLANPNFFVDLSTCAIDLDT